MSMMWINFLCLNKMNLLKTFEKLCDPAKLYLLLSFASVIVYLIHFVKQGKRPSVQELGMQVIVMFIWTFILNKVCTFKYGVKISWVLVALPIVFMILGLLLMFFIVDELDLTKADLQDIMNQAKTMKEEDDELEGFQGCADAK